MQTSNETDEITFYDQPDAIIAKPYAIVVTFCP
jgi:hypothetical protein